MTGSGVERFVRTPSVGVAPTGAATPPAPTQVPGRGAPRRTRGLRWGLRTLVVGGLAGAAWLFTGAAAHAADLPAPAPQQGLSVVSLVNGLGNEADERDATDAAATRTVLDGAERLTGAVVGTPAATGTDPRTNRPARQPAATAGLTHSITDLVPASPAPVVTDGVLAATHGVDGLVKVLAAPFRLTDGPARARGLLAPVPTTEPIVDLSAVSFAPAVPAHAPVVRALSADGVPALPLAPTADLVRDGEHGTGTASLLALQRFAAAHLPDGLTATYPGMNDAPSRPDPTPMHGHPGAVGGAPASGSGASFSEGGSSATVPSSVVGHAEADSRLPAAASVEVRRHDAEAPTVSPD